MIAAPRIDLLPDAGFLIGDRIEVTEGSHGVYQLHYAATGKPTRQIPLAGAPEMARAVGIAREIYPKWRWMRGDQRRQCFLKLAELIRQDAERLAEICTIESGIPITWSRQSATQAADAFEYFGGWTDKIQGDVLPTWPTQTLDYTITEPYGVIGVMLPFNAPLIASCITLAPALAAGNCVVTKPSSMAPFVTLRLGELALEAGFPPGVLQVVPADYRGGEALVRTPGVNKILFMGSGRSAKYVCRAAADRLIPVTTELGGKSAHLIFEDMDPKQAARLAIGSGLSGVGGQGCALGTRMLVHSSIYNDFLDAAVATAEGLRLGDPMDPETEIGPMVNAQAAARIQGICDTAVAEKYGRLLTGGRPPGGELAQGAYFEPTIFGDVDNRSPLGADEIFGPVLTVTPFDTEAQAVALANDSEFGLAAYIQTDHLRRAHRLAALLEAGGVYVNESLIPPITIPFGGTKQSGFGRLGGLAAIRDMTQQKNVSIAVIESPDYRMQRP